MKLFGDRLALVGQTEGDHPVGCWTSRTIAGTTYPFFSVGRRQASAKRPLIPARLTFYTALRRFRTEILSLGCKAAFTQAPDALMAVSHWQWESLCYWFAGVENPLKTSRYPIVRPLWRLFDILWFSALKHVNVVLAAADESAIRSLVTRSRGQLSREMLIQVPTCVDTSVFHPVATASARAELGIPESGTVFVTPGRISRLKGWELLLDAFEDFLRRHLEAVLIFVGDGEDRPDLEAEMKTRGLDSHVRVTGFQRQHQVASYLNSADVVVFGSFVEGWSVAMLEALACGRAIVSTEVSGAETMIKSGQNGFVVKGRNAVTFADSMEQALSLANAGQVSSSIAGKFDLTKMGETLARVWPPFYARG